MALYLGLAYLVIFYSKSGILWGKKSPNKSSFPLRLQWTRGKRPGDNSVEVPFTCSSPLLLRCKPHGFKLETGTSTRGLLPDGFWIFLHQYLEVAEISRFVFQRSSAWLYGLLPLVTLEFNRFLFSHLPSHWDLSPQSLHLCLSNPIKPPRPLLVTLSFHTGPLPRKTMDSQSLTLYP